MPLFAFWNNIPMVLPSSRKLLAIACGLLMLNACTNQTFSSDENNTDIHQSADINRVGPISADELIDGYNKFAEQKASFEPDESDLRLIKQLQGFDLIVFFGLWCHDSEREVPRLLKLIEQSEVQLNSLQLIALNQKKELTEEHQNSFKVDYTPTFFVMQEGQVLATMVEKPEQSIAKDLLSQILH